MNYGVGEFTQNNTITFTRYVDVDVTHPLADHRILQVQNNLHYFIRSPCIFVIF